MYTAKSSPTTAKPLESFLRRRKENAPRSHPGQHGHDCGPADYHDSQLSQQGTAKLGNDLRTMMLKLGENSDNPKPETQTQ